MVSICNSLSHDIIDLNCKIQVWIGSYRVESGSDDPDNLGHLGHLNGSHLQTKLSGCDPDITCSLGNSNCIW